MSGQSALRSRRVLYSGPKEVAKFSHGNPEAPIPRSLTFLSQKLRTGGKANGLLDNQFWKQSLCVALQPMFRWLNDTVLSEKRVLELHEDLPILRLCLFATCQFRFAK